jgi:HEXXH motif-containing protein
LQQAARWIGLEPSLAATIVRVVDDIHLLRAASAYDVSHSEPRWRRRIFVSVPERSDELGELRLAESVVHEAMHLHLTNSEAAEPLVTEFRRTMKSPWRAEPRSYQGVLHGLFVFTCLETYFCGISSIIGNRGAAALHLKKRLDEIRGEVAGLNIRELSGGLTSAGVDLAWKWYNRVLGRDDGT